MVFTDALPGERLIAEVTKVKRGSAEKLTALAKPLCVKCLVKYTPVANMLHMNVSVPLCIAGYVEASKITTLQQHADAPPPPCMYFGTCAGCNYQSLQYAAQLQVKQAQVAEALQRIGGTHVSQYNLLPILPCQDQFRYRNNMQFTFSSTQSTASHSLTSPQQDPTNIVSHETVLGLHAVDDPSCIVPIQSCLLQNEPANKLLQAATTACNQQPQLSAYDSTTQQGFLRQLIIRRNSAGEHLVSIVTTSYHPDLLAGMVRALCDASVNVAGIVNKVVPPSKAGPSMTSHSMSRPAVAPDALVGRANQAALPGVTNAEARRSNKASRVRGQLAGNSISRKLAGKGQRRGQLGQDKGSIPQAAADGQQRVHVLFGVSAIREQLCGLEFNVSADSFFQVNTRQAEVLYQMVAQAAGEASTACPNQVS